MEIIFRIHVCMSKHLLSLSFGFLIPYPSHNIKTNIPTNKNPLLSFQNQSQTSRHVNLYDKYILPSFLYFMIIW